MQLNSIKDVLVFWRERQADKSLAWFANRTGVSPSTIQRIIDGGTKIPDYFTGRSICLNAIENSEEAYKILLALYPDKEQAIARDFKSQVSLNKKYKKIDYEKIVSTEARFYVYHNCSDLRGISRQSLEKLGREYIEAAKYLEAEGFIVARGNDYFCNEANAQTDSSKYTNNSATHLLGILKKMSSMGLIDAEDLLAVDTDGYSEEGEKELKSVIQEAFEKISKIRENERFRGDRSIGVILMASKYDLLKKDIK